MITKGRVFIKAIPPKLVKEYADLTLVRGTGLVNITNIYHTRTEYKFIDEDLTMTTYNLGGFGVLVAYMPTLDEDYMFVPIHPDQIVRYCKEIAKKHNTFSLNEYYTFETFEFEPFSLGPGRVYARIKRLWPNQG